MTSNRVSATLSTSDRETVLNAIEAIKQAMPFLVSLTLEERKSMPKAGDRGRGFMLNCYDAAQKYTDCLPRTFDTAEMQKDLRLIEDLYPVLIALRELNSLVNDTYFAAQSEAYVAALKVYDAVKSHDDLPGMKVTVDELKRQFVRRNKKESVESPIEAASVA
ncbi:hypothetical protein ACQ4M3_19595 [Leptolyngbya sp. AN03gr2]|uniref:hypothetical protein n=1 Tax=unclassified Leptolyngbya TaxID=2650499 RepID=UPI003D3234DD